MTEGVPSTASKTPRGLRALGVPCCLPRARGIPASRCRWQDCGSPLPVAEKGDPQSPQRSKNRRISVSQNGLSGTARRSEAKLEFPQRSKIPRISVSPQQFSGTARWTGGPLCVPCGYAVDEVPAKRIKDSIVSGQVGQGTVPCPTQDRVVQLELVRGKRIPQSRRLRETRRGSPL